MPLKKNVSDTDATSRKMACHGKIKISLFSQVCFRKSESQAAPEKGENLASSPDSASQVYLQGVFQGSSLEALTTP